MPICTSSTWEWLPNNENLIVVHSVIICGEDTFLHLEVIDLTSVRYYIPHAYQYAFCAFCRSIRMLENRKLF